MMAIRLNKQQVIYNFSKEHPPALIVENGATIQVETADCFTDQIDSANYAFSGLNWDQINPATGPIFVKGAEPGDVLKVKIKKIELDSMATMITGPDMGFLGSELTQTTIKKCPIKNDFVQLTSTLKVKVNKMIGVIGTAPKDEAISCGTPDAHGGNMDCKEITEGADLYLPVHTKGALLALGDVHAAMGDGEVAVCGAEVASLVTIEVHILKNSSLPTPLLVNSEKIMTISSFPTLDEASVDATKKMVSLLQEKSQLSSADAILLLSLAGDLRICQIVDPNKTVRMELDKHYFKLPLAD
ncbi:Acetamidase/formamidase [Carnobacterium maltaromaticum]|uniref:acetamidase/formamidase family protein n=2 Tax=Carnobacterium maltaromaticum TaxID=2751 RepID=UPI0009CE5BD2|nr:Acetamidase/formamidase [Carnobacterium maltaromaticum]